MHLACCIANVPNMFVHVADCMHHKRPKKGLAMEVKYHIDSRFGGEGITGKEAYTMPKAPTGVAASNPNAAPFSSSLAEIGAASSSTSTAPGADRRPGAVEDEGDYIGVDDYGLRIVAHP